MLYTGKIELQGSVCGLRIRMRFSTGSGWPKKTGSGSAILFLSLVCIVVYCRHAETMKCWTIKFQLDYIFVYICGNMVNCLQMYIICPQIWPILSVNVASSWNSRLQHFGVSARLVYCTSFPRINSSSCPACVQQLDTRSRPDKH